MKTVNVNLGSGPGGLNGWINYDYGCLAILSKVKIIRKLLIYGGILSKEYDVDWPEIVLHDIRKPFPLKRGSVDNIYCSHVLEHMSFNETKAIFKECCRVLKRQGLLRVVLPDLEKIWGMYKKTNRVDVFMEMILGYRKEDYVGLVGRFKELFIRGHQSFYDLKSLREIARVAGLGKVVEVKYAKGRMTDAGKLDNRNQKSESRYYEFSKI